MLPEWCVVGLDADSAVRMSSKTKPFVLSCDCVPAANTDTEYHVPRPLPPPPPTPALPPPPAQPLLAPPPPLPRALSEHSEGMQLPPPISFAGLESDSDAGLEPEPTPEPGPTPTLEPPQEVVPGRKRAALPQARPVTVTRVSIMVKQADDLRKDQVVLDTIELMRLILRRELPELSELPAVSYTVLPTAVDAGIVEMVGRAVTLYELEQKRGYDIKQYLMDHNCLDVGAAQRRYVESLASYIIFTYILGIGDRHLENVMLREDGALFHIDFGFILGEEPTKAVREGAQFRLCESQIAAMGGSDHKNYSYFVELCVKMFLCLRRHAAVVYTSLKTCDVALSPVDVQRHFDCRCGYTGASKLHGAAVDLMAMGDPSVTILDDNAARQMLIDALKEAEHAGNYYKINDMIHALAKQRGLSDSLSAGIESLNGWGRSFVDAIRRQVGEEGAGAVVRAAGL